MAGPLFLFLRYAISASTPPTNTMARITRSREHIQAIPIPRAAHLTHQCPGVVIPLITIKARRITGPVTRNLTARRVLKIFIIPSFCFTMQSCAGSARRAITMFGHLWSRSGNQVPGPMPKVVQCGTLIFCAQRVHRCK